MNLLKFLLYVYNIKILYQRIVYNERIIFENIIERLFCIVLTLKCIIKIYVTLLLIK